MDRGKLIKQKRKERGITQEQLAKKCGLSTITIRQYETGKRVPALETVIQIANALNVPFDSLVDDQGKESPYYKAILAAHETLLLYSQGKMSETDISDISKAPRINVDSMVRSVFDEAVRGRRDTIDRFIHNELGLMMVDLFEQLNHDGRSKTVDYMVDLSENPKYQRTDGIELLEPSTEGNTTPIQEKPSEGQTAPSDGK